MNNCPCGFSTNSSFKLDLHRDKCNVWRPYGTPDPDGFQTCKKCLVRKSLVDYNNHPNRKNGKDGKCKECRTSKASVYRSENRDSILAHNRIFYQNNREKLIEDSNKRYYANREHILKQKSELAFHRNPNRRLYMEEYRKSNHDILMKKSKFRRDILVKKLLSLLGGQCMICRENKEEFLTVDHIFVDGNKHRKLRGGLGWKRDVLDGKTDLSRFRVLCHNCNIGTYRLNAFHQKKVKQTSGEQKICVTCLLGKDTSFFHAWKNGRPYYECSLCKSFRNMIYTIKCQELLGGRCSCCGIDQPNFLAIDHINNDGNSRRAMGEGTGAMVCRKILNGSLDRSLYQVLCFNCNMSKHLGDECIHTRINKAMDPIDKSYIPLRFDTKHRTDTYDLVKFEFDQVLVEKTAFNSKTLFESFHYAGWGRPPKIVYAAYLDDVMIAAAKFCTPVRQEVASSLGYQYDRVLELDRFCIHPSYQKKNFASWFLSKVVSLIRSDHSSLLALVSFADPRFGHDGTLYKAANWKSVGETVPGYTYSGPNGEVHKKTVWNAAKARNMTESEYASSLGLIKIETPPKIKYVYVLRDVVEASQSRKIK